MQAVTDAPTARTLVMLGYGKYWRAEEREAYARGFGNGERWSPWAEILRALRGQARIETPTLVLWALISSPFLAPGVDGAAWRARLRSELEALLGEDGIAVCPVFPTSAPKHGWSNWASFFTTSYTTWVNLAGLPALSVPVGFSGNGMPVGVQIVGNPGSEQNLLAAGLVIQRALLPQWVGPQL
jgi:Asp-tRNA(Asn)/Glu-tRNA(Gln) amidotransferase A subunit family amidase